MSFDTDVVPSGVGGSTESTFSTGLKRTRTAGSYETRIWDDASLNIAESGITVYREVLNGVNEETREFLRRSPSLQNCFLGIAPVQHVMDAVTEQQVAQLEEAVQRKGFLLLRYKIPLQSNVNAVLINLQAARRVVEGNENRDLFNEQVRKDIETYFRHSMGKYLANAALISGSVVEKRHGVLSGFPRFAVNSWVDSMGLKAIIKGGSVTPQPIGSFDKEGFAFSAFTPEDIKYFNEAVALRNASGIALL